MTSAIFYASSTGNTEKAAKAIRNELGGKKALKLFNVADSGVERMNEYEKIILGSSTWGDGELQDDWEEVFDDFKGLDFSGKTIALFGLGDQEGYSDEYVDAMGILYEAVIEQGATVIGTWPNVDYEFDESKAVVDDEFVGLALDEDNQSDLSKERITTWCSQIKDKIL